MCRKIEELKNRKTGKGSALRIDDSRLTAQEIEKEISRLEAEKSHLR